MGHFRHMVQLFDGIITSEKHFNCAYLYRPFVLNMKELFFLGCFSSRIPLLCQGSGDGMRQEGEPIRGVWVWRACERVTRRQRRICDIFIYMYIHTCIRYILIGGRHVCYITVSV